MSTIQIRIDEETKREANKVFHDLGIDMTTAIKIYLKRVIAQKGIPFDVEYFSDEELKHGYLLSMQSFAETWDNEADDIYQTFFA